MRRRLGQKQKKEKTEGATVLGRITRGEIERWNQILAMIFQTGEGGSIRNARPPFRTKERRSLRENLESIQ